MSAPRDVWLEANRLRLHLLDWGGDAGRGSEPVILLHGLQEHARAWDLVAPRLAAAGLHVLALDWRGHGDSEWVGRGGYYHFADYVADLAFLVRELGGRAALVGHSMGGNAALTYAGTEPDRVRALVSIEGPGPPDSPFDAAPGRFAAWIDDLARAASRGARLLTLDEATARLGERFPLWPPEVARHMALHGTREAAPGASGGGARGPAARPVAREPAVPAADAQATGGADAGGRRAWKFDPLHQTRSPQPYYVAQARAFWARITCPVLYVEGTRSFVTAAPLVIEERVAALGARRVAIDGAGHHPHLERPDALADALLDFLCRPTVA